MDERKRTKLFLRGCTISISDPSGFSHFMLWPGEHQASAQAGLAVVAFALGSLILAFEAFKRQRQSVSNSQNYTREANLPKSPTLRALSLAVSAA